jgi:hypothetical protein
VIELDGHRVIADGGGSAGGTCADEYGYVYPCSQGVGAVISSTQDYGPPPLDRKTAHRACSQYTQYATCMASMCDPFYGALVAGGPFDPNYRPPIAAFLLELTGIPDAARYAHGSVSGCTWTAAGVTTSGDRNPARRRRVCAV